MLELNASQLLKQLDLTQNNIMRAAIQGVSKAANELANESDKLTPRDEGELVASRKIRLEVRHGISVLATVSYSAIRRSKSGWNFDYAVFQHEVGDWDPTTPGTGPKYLERPLKAYTRRLQKTIADEIKKELR
jgi:hypothetical protein